MYKRIKTAWQNVLDLFRSTIEFRLIWPQKTKATARPPEQRLMFFFPQSAVTRLEILKQRTNAPSHKVVISDAIRTWETITEEVAAGSVFFMVQRDGTNVPVEFIDHHHPTSPEKVPFASHLTLVVDNTNPEKPT